MEHIPGIDRGSVVLYALSTCVWCKKTRQLLDDLGIAYDYTYVDLLDDEESEQAKEKMKEWNPRCSFPTIIINNEKCIVGFAEDQIRETLS